MERVSTFSGLLYLTLKLLACQHQVSLNYMSTHKFGYDENHRLNLSDLGTRLRRGTGRRPAFILLCAVLGLCLALAEEAKADFLGYYALNNFTLNNSNADGSVITPDGGQSIVLTGPNNGSYAFGETDLSILAGASGIVQFSFSYYSSDPSSGGAPYGCGPGFALSCDTPGYLLNGNFVQLRDENNNLVDDITQASLVTPGAGVGLVTFSVTAGESFGFSVQSVDNLDGAGVLTISQFTAPSPASDPSPAPEPATGPLLFGFTAAIVAAQRRIAGIKNKQESK